MFPQESNDKIPCDFHNFFMTIFFYTEICDPNVRAIASFQVQICVDLSTILMILLGGRGVNRGTQIRTIHAIV